MKALSHSEENYLKEIFHLSGEGKAKVSTNALAIRLNTKASSITDMVKKLSEKDLLSYKKYKGCGLTKAGEVIAIQVIRKHRLWETFLVENLNFGWEEVHEVAEQLEHINSKKLIDELDQFLKHPKYDPHGDPIPDKNGNITYRKSNIKLKDGAVNSIVEVIKVNEDSIPLLRYLDQIGLKLRSKIKIFEKFAFDESLRVQIDGNAEINLSKKVAECINVRLIAKP